MDAVLNIYKTEIKLKYNIDISLEETTLKDLWEENKEINVFRLIECICLQMNIMETVGITFYAISMEDILFSNGIFIIQGKTIKIINDYFTFQTLPKLDKKKYFHYPEFITQKSLPCSFHQSSIYYSLGLIVLCVLYGYPTYKEEYYIEDEKIIDVIEKSKGRIYYFLKRCFHSRELLFI